MIDEIYDRSYQAGRAQLHSDVLALVHKVRDAIVPALNAVHRFEWDAPWNGKIGNKAKA